MSDQEYCRKDDEQDTLLENTTTRRSTKSECKEDQVVEERQKTKVLVALLILMVITMSSYMNIAALLPAYTAEHHPGLSATLNGILFSVYQVTQFIASPVVGLYQGRVGRENCIGYGVIALAVATGMFALAA